MPRDFLEHCTRAASFSEDIPDITIEVTVRRRGKDISNIYRDIISSHIDSMRKKIKNQPEIDDETDETEIIPPTQFEI